VKITRKILVCLLFSMILILVLAHVEVKADFVRTEGIYFKVGDSRVNFTGTNCYYLALWASDENQRSYVDEVLNESSKMGLMIRLWGFNDDSSEPYCIQSSPGVYNESVLMGLDYVLNKCQQLDIKVVITLVNNWSEYGGIPAYVGWAGAVSHDDFFTNSSCKQYYRDFTRMLVGRTNTFNGRTYGSDDTIAWWELGNELRCPSDPSGDTLYQWYSTMAYFLKKELGVEQLISTGSEGVGNLFNTGSDFVRNHSDENIDVVGGLHLWPENWSITPAEGLTWFENRVAQAHALGKPCFLGEFNISRGAGGDTSARDAFFQDVFDIVNNNSVGAVAFWLLAHDNYPDYDDYTVYYPDDTGTIAVIEGQTGGNTPTVINVPADYPTIQEAVNAATAEDTISVAAGKYPENLEITTPVTIRGASRDRCIIDGGKQGRVITVNTGSNSLPVVISDLTVRNGYTDDYQGGAGIFMSGCGIISDCKITGNRADFNGETTLGGGIHCDGDYSITVSDNTIEKNYSRGYAGAVACGEKTRLLGNRILKNVAHLGGGGVLMDGAAEVYCNFIEGNKSQELGGSGVFMRGDNGLLYNNLILKNRKLKGGTYGLGHEHSGGGIRLSGASGFKVVNNVIIGNSEAHSLGKGFGGGIGVVNSTGEISNNIFANKARVGAEIYSDINSTLDITYNLFKNMSQVTGSVLGSGNLEGKPDFIRNKCYRLKADSPARDTGDPGIADLDSSRSDMGYYGGPQSISSDPVLADITGVGELKIGPKTPRAGKALSVKSTFKNDGVLETGAFNVKLSVDGVEIQTREIKNIPPCRTKTVSFKWPDTTAGTHQLLVDADYDGKVSEGSEINNQLTGEVEIE